MIRSKKLFAGGTAAALLVAGGGVALASTASATTYLGDAELRPIFDETQCFVQGQPISRTLKVPMVSDARVEYKVETDETDFVLVAGQQADLDTAGEIKVTPYLANPDVYPENKDVEISSGTFYLAPAVVKATEAECNPAVYITRDQVYPDINERQAAPRYIKFPMVDGVSVVYMVTDAEGNELEYKAGEQVEAPTSDFTVIAKIESPENAYFADNESKEVDFTFARALTYISQDQVRPDFNEEQAAPRTIKFPMVPNADVTYEVTDAGGAVFDYKAGDQVTAPAAAFTVKAKLNGPAYTYFDGDVMELSFEYHEALVYVSDAEARPVFDETSADPRTITFPTTDKGEITYTLTTENGTEITYKEGDTATAPSTAFSVTAKLSGPYYTFLEGTKSQDETVTWNYAAAPKADEGKFVVANVWFDQKEDGSNVFRVLPVEGVTYYFTEEDPANDNWTKIRDEWVDDELSAPSCGTFTVRAVAAEGYTFGAGNKTADWTQNYGECKPAEEPSVEPTDEPSTEPSVEPTDEPSVEPTDEASVEPSVVPSDEASVEPSDEASVEPVSTDKAEATKAPAEKAETGKLAKTGASLTAGVVSAALVGAGLLLLRRRTA